MRGQPLAVAERDELILPAVGHQDRNRNGSKLAVLVAVLVARRQAVGGLISG
jgi:hypothetical protein